MSIKDRVISWLGIDERMLTPQQVWGSGGIWRPMSASGIQVTTELAMQAAQGACIRLLADDIAGLPIDVYRKVGGRAVEIDPPDWTTFPSGNRWYTWPAFVSEMVVSLLGDGNIIVRCYPDTFNPSIFTVLNTQGIDIPDAGGYSVNGQPFSDAELMHIPWVTLPGKRRGLSVVEAAQDVTGLELAARQWAGAFFRNGGTLGGMITVPPGAVIDADALREQFEARHTGPENFWRPGVLTGGATFDDTVVTPQNAALEPLWRHVLEEAARIYHIPPHMLASQQPGGSSYSSIEHRSIEYVQHAVVNVTTRLEAALSLLIPGDDTYVKLNVNALLRGDMKSRAEFYDLLLQNKVLMREEVRDKEDLPFVGDLGWLETPNNNKPEAPAAAADEPTRSEPMSVNVSVPQSESVGEVRVESTPTFNFENLVLTDEVAKRLVEEEGGKVRAELDVVRGVVAMQADGNAAQAAQIVTLEADGAAKDERLAVLEAELAQRNLPIVHKLVRDPQGKIVKRTSRQGDHVVVTLIDRLPDGTIEMRQSA